VVLHDPPAVLSLHRRWERREVRDVHIPPSLFPCTRKLYQCQYKAVATARYPDPSPYAICVVPVLAGCSSLTASTSPLMYKRFDLRAGYHPADQADLRLQADVRWNAGMLLNQGCSNFSEGWHPPKAGWQRCWNCRHCRVLCAECGVQQ
jgi:hypothetical protein